MRNKTRFLPAFATFVIAAGLVAGCGTSSNVVRDDATPVPEVVGSTIAPAEGVALGVYYGDRSVDETNEALGAIPAIHLTYFDWTADWASDPVLAADTGRGQTSLVNWEPFGADFDDIVAGVHDAHITEQARAAAALPHPVLLDFAAEMNEEEGWAGHDPELYVAGWRHIHDIFAKYAGDRVEWVWAPNNTDSEGAPPAIDYYPGNEYVDWTGIDGYNWGTSDPDFEWQTFSSVFGDMYEGLRELGKPIIIGETSSSEDGGAKGDWITSIVPTLRSEFPDIKALIWFDIEKERDWRIGSSVESTVALRRLANDPYVVTARTD